MKSVITAGVLFLVVLVFLCVNFFVLNAIFNETLDLFSLLPVSMDALEGADEKQLAEIDLRLNEIYGIWKSMRHICVSVWSMRQAVRF